jgi:transposase
VDAQIKLSVVASDIFGVSGRAMLAGERDPKRLAQLARTRLRAKLGPLAEAFTGFFTDQHAFLLGKMLLGWTRWTPTWPSSTPSLPT